MAIVSRNERAGLVKTANGAEEVSLRKMNLRSPSFNIPRKD